MPYKLNPFSGELDRVMGPGNGTAAIEFATDSGDANPTGAGVITFTGGLGIDTSGSGSTVTITATGSGFDWTEVTTTSDALEIENGYIANNAGLVTLTLPAVAAIGETIKILGKGAGLYRVAQNASQFINFTSSTTTTGVGGSLTATDQFASITLICTTANNGWNVDSSTGNFTIV
jgi:hypothetical protein